MGFALKTFKLEVEEILKMLCEIFQKMWDGKQKPYTVHHCGIGNSKCHKSKHEYMDECTFTIHTLG